LPRLWAPTPRQSGAAIVCRSTGRADFGLFLTWHKQGDQDLRCQPPISPLPARIAGRHTLWRNLSFDRRALAGCHYGYSCAYGFNRKLGHRQHQIFASRGTSKSQLWGSVLQVARPFHVARDIPLPFSPAAFGTNFCLLHLSRRFRLATIFWSRSL
jgi:hypothetical protein